MVKEVKKKKKEKCSFSDISSDTCPKQEVSDNMGWGFGWAIGNELTFCDIFCESLFSDTA